MQLHKLLLFILLLIPPFNLYAYNESEDPCLNLPGVWKGKAKYNDGRYWCDWNMEWQVQTYKETVDILVKTRLINGSSMCMASQEWHMPASCKNALIVFVDNTEATIFGNVINFTSKNNQINLMKDTNNLRGNQ